MSWSSIKTEGIVISVSPLREADKQYKILTPDYGKIDVVGRGALKGKAKLSAHLEPFAVVELEIVQGRRRMTVISVERKKTFFGIQNSLESRILAQASMRLMDRYTREHAEDIDLYEEFFRWLEFLNVHTDMQAVRATFVLGGFLLRILRILGYETQLTTCVNCRQEIIPLAYRWHGGKGGLVCSQCTSTDSQEWFSARILEEDIIKILRFARDHSYEDLLRPALSGANIAQFAQVVHELVSFHIPAYEENPYWEGLIIDVSS